MMIAAASQPDDQFNDPAADGRPAASGGGAPRDEGSGPGAFRVEDTAAADSANITPLSAVLQEFGQKIFSGERPVVYPVTNEVWGTIAFRPGEVFGIAAPPGTGKTAWVMQCAIDAQRLNDNVRVLIANVEMPPACLLERQVSRLSGVPFARIADRDVHDHDRERIEQAMATLGAIGDRMYFMGQPFTLEHIFEAVQVVQPNVLIIDYLQRIECCEGTADVRSRLNTVMHAMRGLAHAGICVVVVSAVGRTSSKKNGGYNAQELGLASFRESGEVEYGCDDAAVLVEEGSGADEEEQLGPRIIKLKHVKSRNRQRQNLRFEFEGSIQRFRLAPRQEESAGPVVVMPPTSFARPWRDPAFDNFMETET
jgi:replicative DNA helicase